MDNFLPIGSVVKVKNVAKDAMIYGRIQKAASTGEIYDYAACPFPEGNVGAENSLLFNHDQIEIVYYVGYQNAQEITYRENVLSKYEKS